MECSKADWKLFRSKIAQWQGNHMAKLNQEYVEILQGDENASDKFWKLEERIKKDKKHPGVILEMRKSNMLYAILTLLRDDVIEMKDLEEFSEEFKEQIQFLVERWYNTDERDTKVQGIK